MNKTLKILLYLVYICTVTVFLLYYLFPSDEVKTRIQHALNRLNPNYNVRIDRVRATFPPGIGFDSASLFYRNTLLLELKKIKISPALFSFFSSQKAISFKGNMSGGALDGVAHISTGRVPRHFEIDARISGVKIQNISALQNMPENPLSGVLAGTVLLDTRSKRVPLKTNLIITDAVLKMPAPLLTPGSLSFRSIRLEMETDQKLAQIRKSLLSGRQMDGQFTGSVFFRDPPGKSILNLTGTIQPHPQFLEQMGKTYSANIFAKQRAGEKGWPLRIYNTIEAPKFAFGQ